MHIARNLDVSFAQSVTQLTHDFTFCDKTNVLGSKTLPELPVVGTYYAHLTQAFTVCYPAGEQKQTLRSTSVEVRVETDSKTTPALQ